MLDTAEKIRVRLEPYRGKEQSELAPMAQMDLRTGSLEIVRLEATARAVQKRLERKANGIRKIWSKIWLWPAGGALAILILFVLLFRYRDEDKEEEEG